MSTPPRSFVADEFLELGLNTDYKGNGIWKKDSLRRQQEKFKSSYRAHPKAMERIWFYLQVNPRVEY